MLKSLHLSAVVLVLLIARSVHADDALSRQVLPKGLQIVFRETHATPLVSLELWILAGARDEGPGELGCAHFLEHMLFKGTHLRPAGQVDTDIERLGAILNAATGPDYARYYTVAPARNLSPALEILADVVRNAILPASKVERERAVILDEIAQHRATQSSRLVDQLYALTLAPLPYSHPPAGTAATIAACTRDGMKRFYDRCYVPERALLVIVGDIEPARALSESTAIFGNWQRGGQASDQATAVAIPLPRASQSHLADPGPRRAVGMAFIGPPASSPAAAVAQVTQALLGTRNGGRFAATECAAHYSPRRDTSLFILTNEGAAGDGPLRQALQRLQTSAPTESEMAAVVGREAADARLETQRAGGLALRLGTGIISGAPPDQEARLRAVTPAQVSAFARGWLDLRHAVTLWLEPSFPGETP